MITMALPARVIVGMVNYFLCILFSQMEIQNLLCRVGVGIPGPLHEAGLAHSRLTVGYLIVRLMTISE